MRDEFFSDDRDLFKWSLVLDLAESHRRVLYVPMCRPDDRLTTKNGIRDDVRAFFRTNRMKTITQLSPNRFDVVSWNEYNDQSRREYFASVCHFLTARPSGVTHMVFVDPDTGIESTKPNSQHVRTVQIAMVWSCLRHGDILLVYQHAPQNRPADWPADKVAQFGDAVAIPSASVHCKTALDVCFLWADKT